MPPLYTLLCYAESSGLGLWWCMGRPLPCHVTASPGRPGRFGILDRDMESLRADRAPLSDFNVAYYPAGRGSSKTSSLSSDAGYAGLRVREYSDRGVVVCPVFNADPSARSGCLSRSVGRGGRDGVVTVEPD